MFEQSVCSLGNEGRHCDRYAHNKRINRPECSKGTMEEQTTCISYCPCVTKIMH